MQACAIVGRLHCCRRIVLPWPVAVLLVMIGYTCAGLPPGPGAAAVGPIREPPACAVHIFDAALLIAFRIRQ